MYDTGKCERRSKYEAASPIRQMKKENKMNLLRRDWFPPNLTEIQRRHVMGGPVCAPIVGQSAAMHRMARGIGVNDEFTYLCLCVREYAQQTCLSSLQQIVQFEHV